MLLASFALIQTNNSSSIRAIHSIHPAQFINLVLELVRWVLIVAACRQEEEEVKRKKKKRYHINQEYLVICDMIWLKNAFLCDF